MDKKKRRRKDGGKRVMRTTNGGHDGANAPSTASSGPVAAPGFDPERYRRHIDHLDMPEDSKADLLRAVGQIMQNFVDRAFGHDAGQLCRKHVDKIHSEDETQIPAVIHCSNNLTTPDKHLSATFQHAGKQQTEESDIE